MRKVSVLESLRVAGAESLTPDQRKAYNAGWRSGQNPTPEKIEAADRRRTHPYWYLGFNDAAGGLDKYESVPDTST